MILEQPDELMSRSASLHIGEDVSRQVVEVLWLLVEVLDVEDFLRFGETLLSEASVEAGAGGSEIRNAQRR